MWKIKIFVAEQKIITNVEFKSSLSARSTHGAIVALAIRAQWFAARPSRPVSTLLARFTRVAIDRPWRHLHSNETSLSHNRSMSSIAAMNGWVFFWRFFYKLLSDAYTSNINDNVLYLRKSQKNSSITQYDKYKDIFIYFLFCNI